MKTYLLPLFALLIVGCGNQSQPSNDAILDDVTQNFNGETENLDSIRVLVRCKEKAQNYFNKSVERNTNLTNRFLRGFRRCNGNDLETAQNALFCVTVLSNNPYSIQI